VNEVRINRERCKGCGLCLKACPKNLLQISKTPNERGFHPAETGENIVQCIACGQCYQVCPDGAIEVIDGKHAK